NPGAPAADPYGAGVSTATLVAAGFTGAGTDRFLYLYQTNNVGTIEISQNSVQWNLALVGAGGTSFGQLVHTTFVPNPISPASIPANPSPFTPGVIPPVVTADATAVTIGFL